MHTRFERSSVELRQIIEDVVADGSGTLGRGTLGRERVFYDYLENDY